MAPDHRELVGYDPADVEWRPIAAGDILLIELPQPGPMLAALIGVAVEVEEHRLRRTAPDVLQRHPVEPGIDVEVLMHAFEQAALIVRRAADQPGLVAGYL